MVAGNMERGPVLTAAPGIHRHSFLFQDFLCQPQVVTAGCHEKQLGLRIISPGGIWTKLQTLLDLLPHPLRLLMIRADRHRPETEVTRLMGSAPQCFWIVLIHCKGGRFYGTYGLQHPVQLGPWSIALAV